MAKQQINKLYSQRNSQGMQGRIRSPVTTNKPVNMRHMIASNMQAINTLAVTQPKSAAATSVSSPRNGREF